MTFPDFIGHLGYIALVGGTLLIGRKNIYGWWPRMVGDLIIVLMGVLTGLTSVWIWATVFFAIDLDGYLKWRKKPREGN